jgi:hypothetical protein
MRKAGRRQRRETVWGMREKIMKDKGKVPRRREKKLGLDDETRM